jgi:hypothetical protein
MFGSLAEGGIKNILIGLLRWIGAVPDLITACAEQSRQDEKHPSEQQLRASEQQVWHGHEAAL